MPKVAYSEEERQKIKNELLTVGLEFMSKQGVQHTTVEQIYKTVGISRTFFYSYFSTKEDLIIEALYFQQPRIIEYAKSLMDNPNLSWREKVKTFLYSCCYGERHGIAVLTIEEQQIIFRRLSDESYHAFREKQMQLFGNILECFGIVANKNRINLFTNLSLAVMILKKAIPDSLPFFVPEAAADTVDFQINAMVDYMEKIKYSSEEQEYIDKSI